MAVSRKKKTPKKRHKPQLLHEWSATIWHTVKVGEEWRKAVTREAKFKDHKHARLWVVHHLKHTKLIYYAEVAHVEGGEDVAVIKFTPVVGGFWNEQERKKPWFYQ